MHQGSNPGWILYMATGFLLKLKLVYPIHYGMRNYKLRTLPHCTWSCGGCRGHCPEEQRPRPQWRPSPIEERIAMPSVSSNRLTQLRSYASARLTRPGDLIGAISLAAIAGVRALAPKNLPCFTC
jgi:hypothetical protein